MITEFFALPYSFVYVPLMQIVFILNEHFWRLDLMWVLTFSCFVML